MLIVVVIVVFYLCSIIVRGKERAFVRRKRDERNLVFLAVEWWSVILGYFY